jgi:septum formation inhibitor-activating ATPase MinD
VHFCSKKEKRRKKKEMTIGDKLLINHYHALHQEKKGEMLASNDMANSRFGH